MSFRLFIYYCALAGAWTALFGWVIGEFIGVPDQRMADAGIKGLALGLFVSLGLSVIDSLWNMSSMSQIVSATMRVVVAVLVGSIGGMMGGMIGQALYGPTQYTPFLIFGWTFTGLLIGAAIGAFDVIARFLKQEDLGGALKKLINGVIGGTVGGLLGGILFIILRGVWKGAFGDKPLDQLWSPSST